LVLKVGRSKKLCFMKKDSRIRLYDGALFCGSCGQCPVVDYHPEQNLIVLSDPAKPEAGSLALGVEEYNTLIRNAKPV